MTTIIKINVDIDDVTKSLPKPFIVHKDSNAFLEVTVTKNSMFDLSFSDLSKRQYTRTVHGLVESTSNITYSNTYKTFTMPIDTTYAGPCEIELAIKDGTKILTLPTVYGRITEGR